MWNFLHSDIFAISASIIAIWVEGRYMYSIITRKTVPNFTGWFIIALSMTFVFFSGIAWGAGSTMWLIGVLAILHTLEAILSLFYGHFRITRVEKWCIALAFFSLFLWYKLDNPVYATIINTLIDTLGMTSIAYKLFRFPETEDSLAWGISVLMYGIDILALKTWTIASALFISMNFIECLIIFLLTFRHRSFLVSLQLLLSRYFHSKI